VKAEKKAKPVEKEEKPKTGKAVKAKKAVFGEESLELDEKNADRPEKKPEKKEGKQKPKKGKVSAKDFVELKPKEVEEAIVHLANEGHTASEIGMILRDQYGIPKTGKVIGKKVGQVLAENRLVGQIPEDLMNLIRKSVSLREHLEKNRKDMSAKRGLMLTVSKIRALEKYYKRRGKLPLAWRYSAETAALLAK
jgi:small subunit ribosomal protein S15